MTTTETAKIMATLWAAYPGFYSKAGNVSREIFYAEGPRLKELGNGGLV